MLITQKLHNLQYTYTTIIMLKPYMYSHVDLQYTHTVPLWINLYYCVHGIWTTNTKVGLLKPQQSLNNNKKYHLKEYAMYMYMQVNAQMFMYMYVYEHYVQVVCTGTNTCVANL